MKLFEIKSQYTLYVDLDGVVADLSGKILEVTGKYPPFPPTGKPAWKMEKRDHMWNLIDKYISKNNGFWDELDKTHDADELWGYVKKHKPIILTAFHHDVPGNKHLKKKWVERHLPGHHKVIITSSGIEKNKYANEQSILIDDLDININAWKSNNGIGIKHKSAPNTIKILKEFNL